MFKRLITFVVALAAVFSWGLMAQDKPVTSSIPELWQKAVVIMSANKGMIPGKMEQHSAFVDSKGKPESTDDAWIEMVPDPKDTVKVKIVKVLKNGKDVTEETLKKREKKEAEEKKGKTHEVSVSFTSDDEPLNPDNQGKVTVKPSYEDQVVDGRNCRVFSYALSGSFIQNRKKKLVTYVGKAWLDAETGAPLKMEYTQQPLPSMAKTMNNTLIYKIFPDGKCLPVEMRIEGSGGFLFIKKRFKMTMTFSDYWKSTM